MVIKYQYEAESNKLFAIFAKHEWRTGSHDPVNKGFVNFLSPLILSKLTKTIQENIYFKINDMKKENYSELLKDPRWQKKRLEIMQRDEFTCQRCGCQTRELHVHHKYYIKGYLPHEYNDDSYVTLCYECHDFEHNIPSTHCNIAKIGDMYHHTHSDSDCYSLCYEIDEKTKTIYLFGIDNLSGFDSIWFNECSFSCFEKEYTVEKNIFDNEEYGYFENSILCVISNLIKGEYLDKNSSRYVFTNREQLFEVKRAMKMIHEVLSNNDSLKKAYKSYIGE